MGTNAKNLQVVYWRLSSRPGAWKKSYSIMHINAWLKGPGKEEEASTTMYSKYKHFYNIQSETLFKRAYQVSWYHTSSDDQLN